VNLVLKKPTASKSNLQTKSCFPQNQKLLLHFEHSKKVFRYQGTHCGKDDEITRAGSFPAHSQVRPPASAHTMKDPPHSTCADRRQARFRSSPPCPLAPAYQAWRHCNRAQRPFRRRTRRVLLRAAPFPACLPAGFLSRLSPCTPFPSALTQGLGFGV
jgi:hypothetical protein